MAGYPPRNTSRMHNSGDSGDSSAPSYRLEDYTSPLQNSTTAQQLGTNSNTRRHDDRGLYERDYATTETDGLNDPLHNSPRPGELIVEDQIAADQNHDDRRGGNSPQVHSQFDAPYSVQHQQQPVTGHQSMDLGDAYATDATYHHIQSSPSLSTHNSRSALRDSAPSGTAPIHPGASVTMLRQDSSQARRRYQTAIASQPGSSSPNEKTGYRSPRGRSQDRFGSSGLGNWSGPAGMGNSPYGQLGNSAPGSGLQSAASSSNNLAQIAEPAEAPRSNAFSRVVFAIYDSSFIVRWIIYIIPVLALLWIPGIVGLTAAPNATVWTVPLLWWSCWLSVVWCGWWGAALAAKLGPKIIHHTVGVVAPELRHYIGYVKAIQFYVGAAGWALTCWISFLPLIRSRATSSTSNNTLYLITQGLFGIFLCLLILLVEKLMIQVIAHNFHKKSYEDRITDQKFIVRMLTALFVNTRDLGRSDTLDGGYAAMKRPRNRRKNSDPTLLVKAALKGVKKAAQSATSVVGAVASEMAGEEVLKPNSPGSMVTAALISAKKSKYLGRRIFYSFCPSYRQSLVLEDIARCFTDREMAERAFSLFDRDGNGDATMEEVEMALLEAHRERMALSRSMRDIDSAVGRLDKIIMSIWWVVSALIIAGLLNASFQTMVASAGTLILGLSWLIGTTAQEILASIIFLFIKHAYDVGDRIDIDGVAYIVLEMQLLSSVFKTPEGRVVQAPHVLLNTKFIHNIRRSGPIAETFVWDVAFDTSFEKIEALRARMIEFLEVERRDFFPSINITIKDYEGQTKLTLSADISFRSNWQNGALKAQRRNKWICALKLAMASLQIYGPAGDPAAPVDPVKYQLVPFDAIVEEKKDEDKATDVKDHQPSRKDVVNSGEQVTLMDPERAVDAEAGPFDSRR